jgi:mono/diheme cytochrome c family protein
MEKCVVWRALLGGVAFLVMVVGAPWGALGDEEQARHEAAAGEQWYERHCVPCHGPGGQPGEAVSSRTKEPVDLRTYAKRNDGRIPTGRFLQIMTSAPEPNPHTAVWEAMRREVSVEGPGRSSVAARGRAMLILQYLRTVQVE